MVKGIDLFREHFAPVADQYVLIGGTAAMLAMADAGLQFRATRDLDIVLHIEALTPRHSYVAAPFPHDIFGRNGLQERHSRARQCAPPSRRLTHPFFFTSGRSVDHL